MKLHVILFNYLQVLFIKYIYFKLNLSFHSSPFLFLSFPPLSPLFPSSRPPNVTFFYSLSPPPPSSSFSISFPSNSSGDVGVFIFFFLFSFFFSFFFTAGFATMTAADLKETKKNNFKRIKKQK